MATSQPSGGLLTLEEWADLDEDAEGELVDGVLEEEEMPTAYHEAIVAWLLAELAVWLRSCGGRMFSSELKLAVASRRGRKADVVAYLPGRAMPGKARGATRRPPSIVVEVVSPRPRDERRDVVDKMKEYAAFGVSYYWLVNPQAHTFEVLELGADGRYTVALTAAEGAQAIPGCEGLTLDLDAMWADADALPDDEPESAP